MAALVVPGLLVAGRLQADDAPEVVASNPGAAIQPGELLFERPLLDGSTLRVTTTEDPNEIAVEWPGSPEPVIVALRLGAVSSKVTGDEWTVLAFQPSPGDNAAHIRAFQTANPAVRDEMELVDSLAVVVVPTLVPPSYAGLPGTYEITIETRDAEGNLLRSVKATADVVSSDGAEQLDELEDGRNRQPAGVEENTDGLPSREHRV